MASSEFDSFCRFAFGFLVQTEVQFLVVVGLAVVVVGEPRMTADADVIAFLSPPEAESLITKAARSGFEVDEGLERQQRHGPWQAKALHKNRVDVLRYG